MDLHNVQYLVVGAGFFGAVIAERIAADLGERVLVIDCKQHLGGNSWSADDPETGIECHSYGSHIFHTANQEVWDYVNRFTAFNSYRHRVLTLHQGRVFQMPVNLATINDFYGRAMTPTEAEALLAEEVVAAGITAPASLEEKAIAQIGRPLYEAFIRGYTLKQWETDPRLLPADIITRLPVRFSYKSDYFNDPWQGIPLDGYHQLFARIFAHPRIDVALGVDFFALREQIPADCTIIYTGPIDRYFGYRFGRLSWRTLDFAKEVVPVRDFQGTAVMNYADEQVPFTRIHEFRHYHNERHYPTDRTVIYREYSRACGLADEPYYPVNTRQDREMLSLYQAAAEQERKVLFGGRLGSYQYLDMDRSIAAALAVYRNKLCRKTSVPIQTGG
jgi:UDP-galactopyranose mutase